MFNIYQNSWVMWPMGSFWHFFLPVIIVVDLTLRSFALWRAARANQPWWFIALLVLNTAGILPAVYLFFVNPTQAIDSEMVEDKSTSKKPGTRRTVLKKK